MKTKIEWATDVWNPVTGCTKVSAGCKHCYAEMIAKRFWVERGFADVRMHPERLEDPLHWRKPRRVFVNSMSDLFHPDVPGAFAYRIWEIMRVTPQHTYMILTKRPDRMLNLMHDTLPNVWLGVSVEDQEKANERIPLLLRTPAAVRFVSCEPLLGGVVLPMFLYDISKNVEIGHLDWVICGGESGPGARPMHPDWARSLRDQCQAAGLPFFFKQWGEWLPRSQISMDMQGDLAMRESFGESFHYRAFDNGEQSIRIGKKSAGRLLDGHEWNEYPEHQA